MPGTARVTLSLPLLQTSSLSCSVLNLTWSFASPQPCSSSVLRILADTRRLSVLTSSPVIEAGACSLASPELAEFVLRRLEVTKAFSGTACRGWGWGCLRKSPCFPTPSPSASRLLPSLLEWKRTVSLRRSVTR